jgi:predicted methyltransferase
MNAKKLRRTWAGVAALVAMSLATTSQAAGNNWTVDELTKALSTPSRSQADRDRDANRKPAALMHFLGVERGMTALDLIAGGGYVTEVLSLTVGPSGKVYMQNPPAMRGRGAEERLANGRLSNVVYVEGNLPNPAMPAASADVAITAMNFHDIYSRGGAAAGEAFMKGVYDALKPGGVFGVIDHAANEGADASGLHRIAKQRAIECAKAAGFVVEAESDILANPADDRTKAVRDAEVRGRTDQFTLKLRKPR